MSQFLLWRHSNGNVKSFHNEGDGGEGSSYWPMHDEQPAGGPPPPPSPSVPYDERDERDDGGVGALSAWGIQGSPLPSVTALTHDGLLASVGHIPNPSISSETWWGRPHRSGRKVCLSCWGLMLQKKTVTHQTIKADPSARKNTEITVIRPLYSVMFIANKGAPGGVIMMLWIFRAALVRIFSSNQRNEIQFRDVSERRERVWRPSHQTRPVPACVSDQGDNCSGCWAPSFCVSLCIEPVITTLHCSRGI